MASRRAVTGLTFVLGLAPAAAAAQAGITPPPARAVSVAAVPAPQPESGQLSAVEQAAVDGVNRERQEAGLPPLVVSPDLCQVARAYSRKMAEGHFFDHADPAGHMVNDRTNEAGITTWQAVAENIARNRGFQDPASVAVREWMKSEGHRENILDDRFQETGLGVWVAPDKTVYFTQIFLTRGDGTK
jgi:uncharacterized protein YkwD